MKKYFQLVFISALFSFSFADAETLVVYSARKEHLVKPVFELYEKETGTKIQYITAKAAPLLQRILAEGKNTPADLFMTVDAGNLYQAAEKDVLLSVDSKTLKKNIPSHLRSPDGKWFGLTVRARTIFYNPKKVKAEELSSYEDLAGAKWSKRLCLRTSKKVYNQSLVAMLMAHHGEKKTEGIVKGWVNNLAAKVFSSDTKVIEAVAAGQCDIGIANSYYYGRLVKKNPDINAKIFWPNQKENGVHVNVSGAGIVKYTKKAAAAQKFLEWLSGTQAQAALAKLNLEYPVLKTVSANDIVQKWGSFKQDPVNIRKAGELQSKATQLMDRVGYR